MADALKFIDEKLSNSITALVPVVNPVDSLEPLTFTEWLKYNTQLFSTTNEFLSRYQSYLTNWYAVKNVAQEKATEGIQYYYTNLINDIIINYSSTSERRYLKNIDPSNPRDLAIAVPFFAKKIKDICLYYSTLRDETQTAAISYNLKGSNTGIQNLLYTSILKTLQTQDIVELFSSLNLSLSSIRENILIEVEDLYDTYPDYYDISPTLPASAYNTASGIRNDYFSLNQVDIDPYLYINSDQSILKSILAYPFYLVELGDNFTIDPLVNSTQLNLLKDSDFFTTVNDNTVTSLNLNTQSLEIPKYIGVDFYYIVTSSTTTAYTSGQLFTADSEFANSLNKRYPSIAAVPSQEFLKTSKEIGLFFKPDKIGLINFNSFKFESRVNLDRLEPNTVYYFPDPTKFGNISGNTKLDFKSPLDFFEENHFNKVDIGNQYKMGDVTTDPYFQTFRAYQAREQTLNTSNQGVSRYIDSQDFFAGNLDTMWSNEDVYPLVSVSQFPIDKRVETLLSFDNNKTLFQYKNDVYGNEYGLYKSAINKQFSQTNTSSIFINYILDGYTFYDTLCGQGYDFNYSVSGSANGLVFSGVILRTSESDPATFSDGNPIILASYDFSQNYKYLDSFKTFDSITYSCIIKDAETFTLPNNTKLPDIPSDDIQNYNVLNSSLYYDELADGAYVSDAPYNVASFTFNGNFLTIPPVDKFVTYDGNVFIDSSTGSEPCTLSAHVYSYTYTEPANFKDVRVYDKETLVDFALSGVSYIRPSLYHTKNVEQGELYFRNINSTIIGPISSTLSAAFLNFSDSVRTEIFNKAINFDLYYDTIQIETENYLVFDKLEYNYADNEITGNTKTYDVIVRGEYPELEKFSTVWFNEKDKTLLVCKTTLLLDSLSASNYKVVYPTIYKIDLTDRQMTQIYPTKLISDLTFNDLSLFSLFGKQFELNIVTIEKPVLNYSVDTDTYTLTYLAKDTASCFYIVTIRFKYINNIIKNINCTLHKPATDTHHITFGNPTGSPYLETHTIVGSAAGFIDSTDHTFTWGYE